MQIRDAQKDITELEYIGFVTEVVKIVRNDIK